MKKQFTINELIVEINEIRNDPNNDVEVPALPCRGSGRLGHDDYAQLLAKYRKVEFAKDTTIKEDITESIQQSYELREATTEEQWADLLSNKVFALLQNVLDIA